MRSSVLMSLFLALALSPFALPPSPAPAQTVIRLTADLGIPADPTIDVADRINDAIRNAPDGTTLVFEGLYRADRTIHVEGKANLTLQGVGGQETGLVRYVQNPAPRLPYIIYLSYFMVQHSSNIRFLNLTVRGPLAVRKYDSTLETAHAFVAGNGAAGVSIAGARVSGVHGDVLYIGGQPHPANVTFEDSTGSINGRQGIGVASGHYITIRRVTVQLSGRSGLDIEPHMVGTAPGAVTDVLVEDTAILDYQNFGIGVHWNTALRYTFRRVTLRGGLGPGRITSDSDATRNPPHQDIRLVDVAWTFQSPAPRNGVLYPGSFYVIGVKSLQVLRAALHFGGKQYAVFDSEGTVEDSAFSNAKGTPAACLGPLTLGINNTGTFSCPRK